MLLSARGRAAAGTASESAKHGTSARSGVGVVDGVVYSLLGLLVGFSFSGAADRFDARRLPIGDEVHAIGDRVVAIDVLPPESQPPIRDGFKRYLGALLAADTSRSHRRRTSLRRGDPTSRTARRDGLADKSVAAVSVPSGERARLDALLPALREMFVAAERERSGAVESTRRRSSMSCSGLLHSPPRCSPATHSRQSTRNWMYMVGVAAAVSISTYVILDLEYPRLGVFRVDPLDQV